MSRGQWPVSPGFLCAGVGVSPRVLICATRCPGPSRLAPSLPTVPPASFPLQALSFLCCSPLLPSPLPNPDPPPPAVSGAVCAAARTGPLFIRDLSQLPRALALCTGVLTLGPRAPLFLDICRGHSTTPLSTGFVAQGPVCVSRPFPHWLRPQQGPGGPGERAQNNKRRSAGARRGQGLGLKTQGSDPSLTGYPRASDLSPDLGTLIWGMGLLKGPAPRVLCGLRTCPLSCHRARLLLGAPVPFMTDGLRGWSIPWFPSEASQGSARLAACRDRVAD